MSISSSNYAADAYVTAANPAPGRDELFPYLVTSGTGFEERYVTKSDGGIGLNVYLAGGTGPFGVIPVSQTNPTSISLSGVTIGGVITVTSSFQNPVWVTGGVTVLNPLTGVVQVSQTNIPTTQSVYVVNQTSGSVTVSGVAVVSGTGVFLVQEQVPVTAAYVLGTASVSVSNPVTSVTAAFSGIVGVSQTNLPATQSVFVVNQQSSSITGTVTVSGTGVFQVTGSVYVLNPNTGTFPTGTLTATITGPVDANIQNWPLTQTVRLDLTGALPVSGTVGVSGTASVAVVSLPGPLEVFGVVAVSGTATMVITGVLPVSQTNLPTTQSVYVVNQTSGSVTVAGTASITGVVHVDNPVTSLTATVYLTGVLPVSQTNVPTSLTAVFTSTLPVSMTNPVLTASISNFPVTQSVYVVNQSSASLGTVEISGVQPISGALPITGTVTVQGISLSGSITIPPTVGPSSSVPTTFSFSTSTITLAVAAPNRLTFSIYNDSDQTYLVRLGAGASTSSWTFSLFPQHFYESPNPGFTGLVTGIGYGAGSGTIHVEEMF